jgi:hypothetical protein
MRWVSSDGRWRVDQIRLTLTGIGRDGVWLRITDRGLLAWAVTGGEKQIASALRPSARLSWCSWIMRWGLQLAGDPFPSRIY